VRRRVAIGRILDLPVGAVHVREDGPADAPVVVLLHGFASSMHSFDRIVPLLATDRHVLRVDLLGHGCSTHVAAGLGDDRQATMVLAVLDHLGRQPETVVGHSFGADVAIAVAEQGGQVDRLVLIGQAPDYGQARMPRGSSVLGHRVLGPLVHRFAVGPTVNRASRFAFAPGTRAVSLFDRPDRRLIDVRATAPAAYRAVLVDRPARLAERPLDRRLGDLGVPTLVVLGEQDQLYPVTGTRERYARVRGVRVEVLAGSGHSPPLEQPDATARLIHDFTAGP
jgi:pimeloyl-ACP methyl ester carboxylesterase